MRNLNLNRLFYFHTFARKKNVVSAAKELLISQPALSSQLRQLEKDLDVTLFDRSTRNLDLTEKGQHLFYFTKQIFQTCEAMLGEINPPETKSAFSLRIGISDQIDRSFCVKFISSIFHDKIPVDSKRFSASSTSHDQIVEEMKNGNLDIALSHEATENEFVFPLANAPMPVVLACPKAYRGNRTPVTGEATIEALRSNEMTLIMPSTKLRLRSQVDSFLKSQAIVPNIVFEADILGVLIRAVVDGLGASFIPFSYVTKELADNKVKIAGLPDGFWQDSLWLLISKKIYRDPLFPEMKPIFESAFKKLAKS